MPTLNDDRFQSLRDQGFTGATNDMLLQWLQDAGATAKAITDAWREVLVDVLSVGPESNYQRSDYWWQWLKDNGYDTNGDHINDMESLFWQQGGSLSVLQYFWNPATPGPASATFAAWTPNSSTFTIKAQFRATDLAGLAVVLGGNAAAKLYRSLNVLTFDYPLAAGGTRSVNLGSLVQDQDYAFEARFTPSGVSILLDGVEVDSDPQIAASAVATASYDIISGAVALLDPWVGFISDVEMVDFSVLNDSTRQLGDDTFWGELDAGIPLSGDFEIEFDWVRTDRTGTGNQLLLAANNASPHLFTLNVQDSGGSPANRVQIGFNAVFASFTGALDNVAQGQQITLKITRVGTTVRCFVDGNEVASSPVNGYTQAGTYVDRVGTNHNNGVRYVGGIGNLKITTDGAPLRGFLDYGTPHPDLLEENTFTSAANIGNFTIGGDAGLNDYNSNGLRVTPTIDGGAWISLNGSTTPYPDLITTGFTFAYEMEKSAFDGSVAGNDRALIRFVNADALVSSDPTEAFDILGGGATPLGVPAKTKVLGVDGTHAEVVLSYDPAASANGTLSLYVERFLVGEWALPNPVTAPTLTLSGLGGITGAFNFTERIRNVSLYEGPINVSFGGKVVVGIGDSNIRRGQYQAGTDVNNDPPLVGYNGTDYPDGGPTDATETFQNESLFAVLRNHWSKLGIYPTTFQSFARGGASVLDNPVAGMLSDRIDAAFNIGAEYPTPGIGTGNVDIWVVSTIANDVSWMDILYPGDPVGWQTYVALMRPELQAQLDRMIDGSRDGRPDVVVLLSSQRRYDQVPERDPVVEPERLSAETQLVNSVAAEFDGYRGVVRYVDIYTGWNTGLSIDGLHANEQGHNFIAQQIQAVMPDFNITGQRTYTFPLNEGSGTRINNTDATTGDLGGDWTAENWTAIEPNDRRYRMNEGTGATLADSGDPGGNDATISPFDESNWQGPP